MSYYEQNTAAIIYERKFALDFLCRMYQEGRLYFPHPGHNHPITAASLIRAIQIGIPMPVIYASELQNGDFLILESKNRLISLLEYLHDGFPVYLEETVPFPGNGFFSKLNQQNPWLAGMLLRTVFQLQIIDYHTPKYLHMETGLFHEKWTSAQEWSIRSMLYAGHGIEDFQAVYYEIIQMSSSFPQSEKFLREYELLYILLFWGIYCNKFSLNPTFGNLHEQQLLEITIQNLYNWHDEWADFQNIWISFISCPTTQFILTSKSNDWHSQFAANKKMKLKALGFSFCLFDMSLRKGKDPSASLNFFINSGNYTAQTDALQISSGSIYSYLNSLWEDIRL